MREWYRYVCAVLQKCVTAIFISISAKFLEGLIIGSRFFTLSLRDFNLLVSVVFGGLCCELLVLGKSFSRVVGQRDFFLFDWFHFLMRDEKFVKL